MIGSTPYLDLLDATQVYFQGEKIEALVFILPLGLLSMVFGAWLLTDQPGQFAKGVAIPFLLMGMLMTTVGSVVGFRTPAQMAGVVQAMQAETPTAVQAETDRMLKVNQAWPMYLGIWAMFGVVGLVLRFALSTDFFQGLGIALVFFAGIGLLIDGFAERRTHPYTDALKMHAVTLDTALTQLK